MLAELIYAGVLGASLLAYGVSISLTKLVVINTFASVLAGFAYTPGGMGARQPDQGGRRRRLLASQPGWERAHRWRTRSHGADPRHETQTGPSGHLTPGSEFS